MKKNYFYIVLAIFSGLMMFPQLMIKYPSLIDDGVNFLTVKNNNFFQIFWHQLFIDERTRPLQLIFRKILFEIWGFNISGNFLAYTLLLFGVGVMVWKILEGIFNDNKIKWLSLLLFTLPGVYANFYRLGTDETIQLFSILVVIALVIRKKWKWGMIVMLISLLTKETSILFLMALLVFYLVNKRKKEAVWGVIGAGLFIFLVCFKYQFYESATYIRTGELSWKHIMYSFTSHPVLAILVIVLPILLWIKRKALGERNALLMALLISSCIGEIVIWDVRQEYYWLIIEVLISIGIAMALSQIKYWPLMLVMLAYLNFNNTMYEIKYWHGKYLKDEVLVEYLLNKNWKNTNVYIDDNDFEENDKIRYYISSWNTGAKSIYPDTDIWLVNQTKKDRNYFIETAKNSIKLFNENKTNSVLISNNEEDLYKMGKELSVDFQQAARKICGKSWLLSNPDCFLIIEKNQ